MKSLKHFLIYGLLLVLCSCNLSPKLIDYGNDGCHYCKMTIVDKVHGAEIVTTTGKIYMFDAMECLINFMSEFDKEDIAQYHTNNYLNPELLIDARKATYVICEKIPSPMGAFLTAFRTEDAALAIIEDKGGQSYSWNELLEYFENLDK